LSSLLFFLQAEDGIRIFHVTGVQTCALPISIPSIALLYYLFYRASLHSPPPSSHTHIYIRGTPSLNFNLFFSIFLDSFWLLFFEYFLTLLLFYVIPFLLFLLLYKNLQNLQILHLI